MANVACLYLLYLTSDSAEGIIIFYNRDLWTRVKKFFGYITNAVMTFALTAGILLYMPLLYWLVFMGVDTGELDEIRIWIYFTAVIFVFVLIFSIIIRKEWGNIQHLGIRLAFFLYCFMYMHWAAIVLVFFAILYMVCLECKKYNWNWKELCKKDIRFRRKKGPRF